MAGVGTLLKQAAKMQKKIEALQAELAAQTLDVAKGGGAVKVTISLKQEIKDLHLDPEFLKEDAATVRETILEALREAIALSQKQHEAAMQSVTAGMKLPGM